MLWDKNKFENNRFRKKLLGFARIVEKLYISNFPPKIKLKCANFARIKRHSNNGIR